MGPVGRLAVEVVVPRWLSVLGIVPFVAGVRLASAQPGPTRAEIAHVDSVIPGLMPKYHIAAVGVGIIRNGQLVWSKAYGEQGPGVPATTETLWNVASMTKPITAEIVLRLASAGKLTLDESMAPTWVDPDLTADPRHKLLTPRIALTHRTGFPNWRRMQGGHLAFLADPGKRFGYSGEGLEYVARFAEKRTGVSFERLADQYVFGPLGMKNTSFSERPWMKGRIATPKDTTGAWGKPDLHPAGKWRASDDVYTTIADYAKLMIAVMKGDGLRPAIAADRFRVEADMSSEWPCVAEPATLCPNPEGAALGWFGFGYGSETLVWHGGDDWGEHSMAYFYPRTKDGVIVMINGGNGRYAELDAMDALDPHPPIAAFQPLRRSPLAVWMRALLDAAYKGSLPTQKKS